MSARYLFLFALGMTLVIPGYVAAQQDVRGVRFKNEASKLIDEKCLRCHNRKLIDQAVSDRRQMNEVLKRMEHKGLVLTDKERQVMGHFWGQPVFKGEETTNK